MNWNEKVFSIFLFNLQDIIKNIPDPAELRLLIKCLNGHVCDVGKILVRKLKRRDALRRQMETRCDVITRHLHQREY